VIPTSSLINPESLQCLTIGVVARDIAPRLSRLIPRKSPLLILLLLTLGAVAGFAGVSHLVARFIANQQSRGYKLYATGLEEANASDYTDAIASFRAALTCDPTNSDYQLSLARALRDSNDPLLLDEAESYLLALWQRTPQDAAINLALARVAAHRGSVPNAIRYYHNAMYGVWNSDADANRRNARIELIRFLLKENASARAESEIIALASGLPPEPTLHLEAARLFEQAQDYAGARTQYGEVLRLEPANFVALSGAGEAAYNLGDYLEAQRYLQRALDANPQDDHARQLEETADLVLRADPYRTHISDAERNRRIVSAFIQAGERLHACAQQLGVALDSSAAADTSQQRKSPLPALQSSWLTTKPKLPQLRAAETDLPDSIMDLVFQMERQTASQCGQPQGLDLALLLISRKREAAAQ
jgi:tetratricopeptide (TPR) repeat protein